MKLRETDSCDEAKNVPKVSSGKSFEMTRRAFLQGLWRGTPWHCTAQRSMAQHSAAGGLTQQHLIFFKIVLHILDTLMSLNRRSCVAHSSS